MLENAQPTYDEIFLSLQKIILERDFGEIISFEKLIRDRYPLVCTNGDAYSEEIELIELSAIYIFCNMLKEDEEAIFPYLREYVVTILNNSFFDMQEENIQTKLKNEYSLENTSLEQRYLYILSTFGFHAFNFDIGLLEHPEVDDTVIKKMFQKFFLVEYDKFSSETIKGLCLLQKYIYNTNISFDPITKLLFDIILKRIATILVNYTVIKEQRELKQNSSNKLMAQVDKMNLI